MLHKIKQNDYLFIKQLGKIFEEEERRIKEEKNSNCSIQTTATNRTNAMNDQNNNEEKKMSVLAFLFLITKNIILMADPDLLENLMCDFLYNIIFGSLEYDFESQKVMKHRQFLNETSRFINIVSIKEDKIIEKIHVNYRLAYLRDTVLARFLEVNGFTVVNKIIQMNNTDIIQAILLNKEYIDYIINQLLSNDLNIQNKSIMFIVEMMNCSKELFQRLTHFQDLLFQSGLLQTIEFILIKNAEFVVKIKGNPFLNNEEIIRNNIICRSIEILSDLIVFLPYLLKDYLVNSLKNEATNYNEDTADEKDNSLLYALTNLLKHTRDSGIKSLIGQIIKQFINANQDLNINQDSIIFTNCLNQLAAFLNCIPPKNDSIEKSSLVVSKQIILDILSYCLNQLKDHMQYWFIHNSIMNKVLNSINDQSKVLTISVVKFVKGVIETNNYNYQKTLLLSECFDTLFQLFELNKPKANLLLSTIMSLFDSLISNTSHCNNKLIASIFKNFSEIIYKKGNEIYFGNLIKRYELGRDYVSVSRNESMVFHGLFSKDVNSSSQEEEYDEIEGIINSNTHSNLNEGKETVNCSFLSTYSFFNLNDAYILQSNISDSLCFLNKKRRADS